MFYIYTKEKKSKVKFSVNLTAKEVKDFMGNNLFLDYPELNKDDYVIVESNEVFKHPTYDSITNTIREMTREELIEEEIEIQLEPGEIIKNKKLIKVPKPKKNEKYLTWNRENGTWEYDSQKEKDDYFQLVDTLKAEALEYGFDYQGHRQRLRIKDLIYMEIAIKSLEISKKKFKKDLKSTWYFHDNFGMTMSIEDLEDMMFSGTMFIQSIFNSENYFKTQVEPKDLTKEEFKNKINELHNLVMKKVGGKE
ncbi:penicillin-binding protein [Fusobacterium animalis]|uniref:penicillin-binding protein n=1 Tax=Fusobacterium animalis TaxID=76859 RepID=UPI0030D17B2A